MSYAQMAQDGEVVVAPVSNKRIANLETTRVIFFAGDAIPPHEKYEMPDVKGFGGIYLPHIRTMPQGANHGSRGMLYRCKLTALTTKYKSEPLAMLSPEARESWETEFIQTVNVGGEPVEHVVKGFMGSDPNATKEGEFQPKRSSHLVYKKRYPGHDIRMATRRSLPNGVGGVVEIEALAGATNREIQETQVFFFPRWAQIIQGLEDLPETTAALEHYIRTRLATLGDDESEFAVKMRRVGKDMLKSCMEFRRTGAQIVQADEKAFKAAAKDDAQVFSQISTHLLDQLNVTRKEDVVTGGNEAINRLASAMEKGVAPVSATAGMSDEDLAEFYAWKVAKKAQGAPVSIPVAALEPEEEALSGKQESDIDDAGKLMHQQTEGLLPLDIGAEVILEGRVGKIIAKPFGRYKVQFEDGTTQMADRHELG